MTDRKREATRNVWNRVADHCQIHVGDDGDGNRLLNSGLVLWAFAGDVRQARRELERAPSSRSRRSVVNAGWLMPLSAGSWAHGVAASRDTDIEGGCSLFRAG